MCPPLRSGRHQNPERPGISRFWLDLSEREIADAMGVSPGTVKSNVSRGLAALAQALGDRT
jgi:DNA-directed RNA polymerase specialized sigma24 family protein